MRKLFRAAAILLPAFGLIGLTWFGTLSAIRTQRAEAEARITARVANQAASFQQQIHRQILEIDQTLRILAAAWERDPDTFDVRTWRDRAVTLSDISSDILVADNHGLIVQATVPEAVGTNVADQDYFNYALRYGRTQNQAFVSAATVDPILHQRHMELARRVQKSDGSFAGVVVADWRVTAITDLFRAADLGAHPLMELVGLDDGKLRAMVGPQAGNPDESAADTPMFTALRSSPDGTWIGPSAPDGMVRLHAFHRIPGRELAVVVGMDYREALALTAQWEALARLFAGIIATLILIMAGMLLRNQSQARRRQATLTYDRAVLAAANAQLEVAKAHADAKTAQLQATLEGMSDGVAMMDAHLCLVEWNRHFADIAGVPQQLLRIGLPMEDILRAQAQSGQFGPVDMDAEVARRMALLRAGGSMGAVERRRPDGRIVELRRNRLPNGGFVTLYSDVTARKRAENTLREARAIAEAANDAKSRFVAIVSHEIRTPLNALLSTLALLREGGLAPSQQALLDVAWQSGDALRGLIDDILDMSRMEAGQLSLRPSVFALATLIDNAAEVFRAQAAERGMTLRIALAPELPSALYADAGRLRQVLINLLSNAVKYGQPGIVGVLAHQEHDVAGGPILCLAVRDGGPLIEPEGRARLFRPFSQLASAEGEMGGSGLGLAICQHLVTLMGGQIGCDPWLGAGSQAGNEFWVRLPIAPLPAMPREPATEQLPGRRLPRSRVLLVEDVPANQLVTTTMLRRDGHLVDVAADGHAAVEAVARRPYDIVFMDLVMPGMTGLEATRRIRAMPAPAGTVPIVALSSSISADDQMQCRDAGMNRWLAKPVGLPELQRAIRELVWHGLPESGATPRPDAVMEGAVLSAERFRELRNTLPSEMLGGMIEECLIDLQGRLPALRRAMEAGDSAAVASQAHAMVGMAAGYGMAALETRLRALMLAARGSDIGRAASLAAELDAELTMAAHALREALAIEAV